MFTSRFSSLQGFQHPTSSHVLLLMSSLAIIPTYEDSFHIHLPFPSPCTGVHRGVGNDIRRHAIRPTDASVRNCKEDVSPFRLSMVGLPAVWENIQNGIVVNVDESIWVSPITNALSTLLGVYIPVLAQLADSFVLSSCYLRPTWYCIEWGCCH